MHILYVICMLYSYVHFPILSIFWVFTANPVCWISVNPPKKENKPVFITFVLFFHFERNPRRLGSDHVRSTFMAPHCGCCYATRKFWHPDSSLKGQKCEVKMNYLRAGEEGGQWIAMFMLWAGGEFVKEREREREGSDAAISASAQSHPPPRCLQASVLKSEWVKRWQRVHLQLNWHFFPSKRWTTLIHRVEWVESLLSG